ncbi:MAG TPA: DUF1631 domain-containing protein [Gammaproteobacteria bacterium]|nr:DUF1631 domain-containing protein [Gammaproteobacteria bacterium]
MNIIRLDQYQEPRRVLTHDETITLLRQARALMADRLGQAMQAIMAKVDDSMFDLSQKDPTVQNYYFEAMRELRIKRREIEQAFQDKLRYGFGHSLKTFGIDDLCEEEPTLELSLVEQDELEEDIAIRDMVVKMELLAGVELSALNQRFAFMLQTAELDNDSNPISPTVICEALRSALDRVSINMRVKLVIYKLFDRYLIGAAAEPAYKSINEFLIEKGVLAVLPKAARKRSQGQQDSDELFAALQRRIVADGATAGAAPGAQANFLGALSALQNGNDELLQAQGGAIDPVSLASGLVNVIRSLQETGATARMGQADAMVVDVVAMLFDYILDDKNLPDAIKALIGRLQIPVLKVALSDQAFFGKRNHPARRLLNMLAFAGIGWDESLGHDDVLYRKVDEVVQRVLDEYGDNAELFAELLQDFERFLGQEQQAAARRAEVSAQLAQSRERLVTAKEVVRKEVRNRIEKPGVPDLIRDFLGSYWRGVLLLNFIKEGEGSVPWKRSLVFMDNLIWSVEPKPDAQERARVIKVLPNLLQVLQDGMEKVSMPSNERHHFLAQLAGYHARIMNEDSVVASALQQQGSVHDYLRDPNASAPMPPVMPSAEQEEAAATEALQHLVNEGALQAEEITLGEVEEDSGHDISVADLQDEFIDLVRNIQVGSWVEMEGEDGAPMRVKLSWVSPVTSRYLFVNRKGHMVSNMHEVALVAAFQCGKARTIEEAPVMDRAVSKVVEGMRQAG